MNRYPIRRTFLTFVDYILSSGQRHEGLLDLAIGAAYGNQYFVSQLGLRLALVVVLLASISGMCRLYG